MELWRPILTSQDIVQGWRNVSIMCEVAAWGRVGNNMTFSMHKNINTQFMLLGHLNMTDEKDITADP